MSLQILLPWLLIGVLMSALAMVFGVSREDANLTMFVAAGFSIFIIVIGFVTNLSYWREARALAHEKARGSPERVALEVLSADIARRNAKLFAVCYGWSGIAMLAIYSLTQLSWRHGLQYAGGMLLLSAISLLFGLALARRSGDKLARAMRIAELLTMVQTICAGAGLAYLVLSGKLSSTRADWAANYVFLFGGIALLLLGAMALRSNRQMALQA